MYLIPFGIRQFRTEVKIKEIEQGLVPDFIDTIRDPHEIQKTWF